MKAIEMQRKTKPEVGIIGFGNFGKFMAEQLGPYFEITVYDRKIEGFSIEKAASRGIVIIAVPVQSLESVLKGIRPFLKKGALVVDVSSVKVKPVELMEKYLPENVEIIGTHPLFGPQSGKHGIKGLTIVVCGVRTKRLKQAEDFLKEIGLNVEEMTPEQHDREMAKKQAIAHFLGKALKEIGLEDDRRNISTYRSLLALRDTVKDDTPELFETIEEWNPYAKAEREELLRTLKKIHGRLK